MRSDEEFHGRDPLGLVDAVARARARENGGPSIRKADEPPRPSSGDTLSTNPIDRIPKSYPAARAVARRLMWPCPGCRGGGHEGCVICGGAGTFDPAVLLALRNVREAEGMTLEEVAALLDVSRESICRIERGQSLAPRRRQRYRREPAELLVRYLELCRRTGGEMWWPDRGEG